MEVLRLREFRLLLGAQAISWLGDRMVPIALSFAVLHLGGSPADVGIVLACRMLPMIATLLAGGVVADRLSRRAVMAVADVARVLTQGLIAGLLIAGIAEVWMLAVLSGLTGAATGFFNPASTGLLPAIVPPERLQEANGVRATAQSGGEIGGPVLAGALIAAFGPGWALALDASTFAVSAALLAALHLPAQVPRAATSFLTDLREGWGMFTSLTWAWAFVAIGGIGSLMWGAFGVLGPVVAERDLGGAAVWGTVLGAMGIGALLGSLLAVRVRPRRPLVLAAFGYALFVPPLLCLAARAPVPVVALGTFLAGVGLMLGNSIWEATLMRLVGDEWISRVSAYDWFVSLALQPLGFVIWGPIAGQIGIYEALWVATVLLTLNSAVLLTWPAIRAVTART